MLLVWLTGVCLGVAQACVPSAAPLADATALPASRLAPHCHAVQVVAAEAGSTWGGDHRAGADPAPPGKSNCQDYCEKSTLSVPPPAKLLDHGVPDSLVQWSLSLTLPEPPTRSATAAQSMRQADDIAGPSITIEFLRLAL
jgi:hypothetical protein